jgi:predicted MPP superfamily phosphohydrolase
MHDKAANQRERIGACADSLTLCHYTEPREGAANSAPSRNGWSRWLRLGFSQTFEWNSLPVLVPKLPKVLEGFRILHLSDTHLLGRWLGSYDLLLKRLRDAPPDLILFTGDFVDHVFDSRPALPFLERFLTQLTSRLGVWAILGNHDRDLLAPRLGAWGVNLIMGRHVRLESDNAAVELVGLAGVKRRDFDPDWLTNIPQRQPGVPRIVLGHYPDQVLLIDSLEADVMLSGHTHGGQVCLPGGRALLTHDSLPKHMARGVHRIGHTLLVVSRGFGTVRWPIRLFCPAEVIELTMTASASSGMMAAHVRGDAADSSDGQR